MNTPSTTIAEIRAAIEPILAPVLQQSIHDIQVKTTGHTVEVRFLATAEDTRYGCMFQLDVDDDNGCIGINTLLKPQGTERGVGRSLIAAVRDVATRHQYRLFIQGPVNGFFWKLVEWGGHVINRDRVEITNETRLADVTPGHSTFSELDSSFLSDAQRAAGRECFATAYPNITAEIEKMGPQVAEILGVDYEQCRVGTIELAMKELALTRRIEMFDLLLEYAIESQLEREQILQSRRESITRLLGL